MLNKQRCDRVDASPSHPYNRYHRYTGGLPRHVKTRQHELQCKMSVHGAVRCGAVRCGAVRCGAVRCGAVRCGAVRCGAVRCGAVRCGAVQSGAMQRRVVSRNKTFLFSKPCFNSFFVLSRSTTSYVRTLRQANDNAKRQHQQCCRGAILTTELTPAVEP